MSHLDVALGTTSVSRPDSHALATHYGGDANRHVDHEPPPWPSKCLPRELQMRRSRMLTAHCQWSITGPARQSSALLRLLLSAVTLAASAHLSYVDLGAGGGACCLVPD